MTSRIASGSGGFDDAFLGFARREIARVVEGKLRSVAPKVRAAVALSVAEAIRAAPETDSLLSGELKVVFGLADASPAVAEIVRAVGDSVKVSVVPASPDGGDFLGGLKAEVLRNDLSEILSLPAGSYVSRSRRRGTLTEVPWLRWLLTAGDAVVLLDWGVHSSRGSYTGSRTGLAIMIGGGKAGTSPPGKGGKGGGIEPFSVPPQFSGTLSDNWITRSLAAAVGPASDACRRLVEEALR